jgi:hypothetical protein
MLTEAEWLSASEPYLLSSYLCNVLRLNRTRSGRRKFRLFGCGCCRRLWDLFEAQPLCAAVVDTAERIAEGTIPRTDGLEIARRVAFLPLGREQSVVRAARSLVLETIVNMAHHVSWYCAEARSLDPAFSDSAARDSSYQHELRHAAHLVRCIFGNPFRPVTLDSAWRTAAVVQLAQGIYDERAFHRMPILADALEDAGCDNADVIAHCRDAGPHARGCWVVDLVLGKA